MQNFIDYINISNFKSIRDLKLDGLTRINLFIGKPNVGKSNILEAFGVFSLPYLELNPIKKLSSFIRVEHQNELFFDGNSQNQIILKSNIGSYIITKSPNYLDPTTGTIEKLNFDILDFCLNNMESESHMLFDSKPGLNLTASTPVRKILKEKKSEWEINVKLYNFSKTVNSKRLYVNFLMPPNGLNQMQIIEDVPWLKDDIVSLFKEYDLNLVFDKSSQDLKITKLPKDGEIFLIPYNSIADTLQRVIFYKTAIASNQNSVLVFEEPEAHAFPPYISHITHEIIDSKSNQFIISTHSPYVLNDFLENARDELSIFMVDYKNGETVANKLTKENLDDIYGYGIDLFTNYETFLK